MNIQVITDFNDFKKLEKIWNEALSQSGMNLFFLRHEWLVSWWRFHGDHDQLFVILLWDGSELIGAAPLMIRKHKLLFRSVRFIAHGVSDYMDFIITRKTEECFNLIFNELQKWRKKWDAADFRYIREDSPHYNLWLDRTTGIPGTLNEMVHEDSSVIIELGKYNNWDNYFHSMGKSYRDDLKRQESRLRKIGKLEFQKIINYEEGMAIFKEFIEKHRSRWEELSQRSQFDNEQLILRYSNLVEIFLGEGMLDLSCLKLNNERIAFHFGYIYNNCFYYYTPAFNPKYAAYSPGKILLKYLVMDAFSKKMAHFDLLMGTEKYKLSWGTGVVKLVSFRSFKFNIPGMGAYLFIKMFGGFQLAKIKLKNNSLGRKLIRALGFKI